ncbi:hypothetical protein LRC484719_30160 [Mycobacterium riyadhense]|uniref:HNH endonuclease n=1 Tax=Mycobacterium riyadhense TaxID=486698 RepID=A0A653EBB4_9MYCO|nr:HNH endonuclease [Mycobacterium riyadhense]VTO94723.1 HNH endonuclease [Mycobacterium riyadhense]
MPTAPARACSRCRRAVPKGQRCQCHPSWEGSTRGGSTRQWRKIRAAKLRATPICEYVDCRHPATEVDHIMPRAEGGTDDWGNLASLCGEHHREKTAEDSRRGRERQREGGGL